MIRREVASKYVRVEKDEHYASLEVQNFYTVKGVTNYSMTDYDYIDADLWLKETKRLGENNYKAKYIETTIAEWMYKWKKKDPYEFSCFMANPAKWMFDQRNLNIMFAHGAQMFLYFVNPDQLYKKHKRCLDCNKVSEFSTGYKFKKLPHCSKRGVGGNLYAHRFNLCIAQCPLCKKVLGKSSKAFYHLAEHFITFHNDDMEFLYKEHKISWAACIAVKKQTPDDQEKNQDSEEELKLDPRTDIVEMPNREGSLPDPGHPAEPYCSLKKFYFISTPEVLDTATVRIFNSYYMRNSVSYAFSQRALKEVEFKN